MTDEERHERRQRLAIDVDTRMSEIWATVWGERSVLLPVLQDDVKREALGAALRAAYALGYADALYEDSIGRRGELSRANGY